MCSQCVKTSEGVRPWLLRHGDREPEDFIRDGFVCAREFLDDREAESVCDDGHCVGCKVSIPKKDEVLSSADCKTKVGMLSDELTPR